MHYLPKITLQNLYDLRRVPNFYEIDPARPQLKMSELVSHFFCSDTLRHADVKKNSTPDPGLGLYLDAYLTCDGFTYNVTRTQGPPTPGKAVTNIQKKFNMLLVFTSYFHLQKYKNIIFRLSNLTTER